MSEMMEMLESAYYPDGSTVTKEPVQPFNSINVRIADLPWDLARLLPDPKSNPDGYPVVLTINGITFFEGKLEAFAVHTGRLNGTMSSRDDGEPANIQAVSTTERVRKLP